jgi:hypothetical protein
MTSSLARMRVFWAIAALSQLATYAWSIGFRSWMIAQWNEPHASVVELYVDKSVPIGAMLFTLVGYVLCHVMVNRQTALSAILLRCEAKPATRTQEKPMSCSTRLAPVTHDGNTAAALRRAHSTAWFRLSVFNIVLHAGALVSVWVCAGTRSFGMSPCWSIPDPRWTLPWVALTLAVQWYLFPRRARTV